MADKKFPFKTQLGTFENEQQIEQWINNNEDYKNAYCLISYAPFIYTRFIIEILERYHYHTLGIISFSNIFDELPAWWIDALNIINIEIPVAQKAYAAYIKQKRSN